MGLVELMKAALQRTGATAEEIAELERVAGDEEAAAALIDGGGTVDDMEGDYIEKADFDSLTEQVDGLDAKFDQILARLPETPPADEDGDGDDGKTEVAKAEDVAALRKRFDDEVIPAIAGIAKSIDDLAAGESSQDDGSDTPVRKSNPDLIGLLEDE